MGRRAKQRHQLRRKPNYGQDSPAIIVGLLIVGATSLAVGLLFPHLFRLPMRWIGILAAAYFLQGAFGMLFYSKVGKLRMREEFLNSIAWRGDEQVLDIGCGRGLLTVAAADRLATGCVVGVDVFLGTAITGNRPESVLDNAMIEGVRDRIEVKNGDARKLPFPAGSFDIVVSNFVLHEMRTAAEREAMIGEIARVLKPDGQVALRDFIFTDVCVQELRKYGVEAKRERVGKLGFWVGMILNFGFLRLYHVTGQKRRRVPEVSRVCCSSLCYSQTTGSGNAAGVEESRRQGCFDSLLILHVSNKLEAALQTPNLCVRFPVLPEVASPTTSPDLREVR